MNIPVKILRNGFQMPVFGLGTWGMGGKDAPDRTHDKEDVASITRALDAGITHIDTAEKYGDGHAEELVGQAIRGRDRSQLLIVSKVRKDHLEAENVLRSAHASLKRLGTDYLDLYLVHSFNPAVQIAETIGAMNRLVDEGLIRHIGLSNYHPENIEEAMRVSRQPIVAVQLHYNLGYRDPERRGLLAHAAKNDWMLVAWRPIRDILAMNPLPDVLMNIAKKYGKTPTQIALNWLISQQNVVTLAKCGTKEHLDDALGTLDWTMEPEDCEALRREFPESPEALLQRA